MTSTGVPIARTTVQPWTDDETQMETYKVSLAAFDASVKARLDTPALLLPADPEVFVDPGDDPTCQEEPEMLKPDEEVLEDGYLDQHRKRHEEQGKSLSSWSSSRGSRSWSWSRWLLYCTVVDCRRAKRRGDPTSQHRLACGAVLVRGANPRHAAAAERCERDHRQH
jgi:hypothetical protein